MPIHNSFSINNDDFLRPTVASIEITSACNLKCRHCYGEFGNKSYHMSLDKIMKLLDDLEEAGVKMIELTGGDISVHPNIQAIVEYALSKKFVQVALLTNGILLTDEMLTLLIRNKQRVVIPRLSFIGVHGGFGGGLLGTVPRLLRRRVSYITLQTRKRRGGIIMAKTYENAGVNLEAGYEVVSRIKKHVASTARPGSMFQVVRGRRGGLFQLPEGAGTGCAQRYAGPFRHSLDRKSVV